jgi:DNA-binding IclR family transcriptional regulator
VYNVLAWDVVLTCALDSIPAKRLAVLRVLACADTDQISQQIADALRYPTTTIRRTLEELAAHGLVTRDGSNQTHRWAIEARVRSTLRRVGLPTVG